MKSNRFANVKLRMPRATLLHSTREVLELQATQGGIAPTLKSVGARVEMLQDLSCFMSFHRAQEIVARKQVSCCGNCGEIGHWHKECLHPPRKHAQATHAETNFVQYVLLLVSE